MLKDRGEKPLLGDSETANVFQIRVADSVSAVPAEVWDELVRTGASLSQQAGMVGERLAGNPFICHAFLRSLEEAGCVGQRVGWLPQHLVLQDPEGAPIAVAPAYLKNHSQGEYVFDHGWADAFERAGGRYYPKLQLSVPFTPATGPRLLVGSGDGADVRRSALCAGIRAYIEESGVSSAHATFLEPDDLKSFEDGGFLHRTDQQFHFRNRNFASYDAFLQTLASRKRKGLRKERQEALSSGIDIVWLSGTDLIESVWDAFYAFYTDTGSRKWGRPYLNRRFFSLVGERMGERIVLMMARRAGRFVAGALNFLGDDTIYGRYWGCIEDHPCLHFELCYHQAIDYAIQHKLGVVEAGAQGEHKLARGYEPVTTHSAHYIAHPGLRKAIEDHLDHEREHVHRLQTVLSEHTPFKKGNG